MSGNPETPFFVVPNEAPPVIQSRRVALFSTFQISGDKQANKHKQFFRHCPGNGWGSNCLCVAFFLGKKGKHINKFPGISRKYRDSPGTMPGKSPDNPVKCFYLCVGLGFWQNVFFFIFEPPDLSADFVTEFCSWFWGGKPIQILQESAGLNPLHFMQQKSPTYFCRGAGTICVCLCLLVFGFLWSFQFSKHSLEIAVYRPLG